jgi:hypothetical protein
VQISCGLKPIGDLPFKVPESIDFKIDLILTGELSEMVKPQKKVPFQVLFNQIKI